MALTDKEATQESSRSGNEATCNWCGTPATLDESGTPYVICRPCYARILSLSSVYKKQLDELPFGVIELDPQGMVTAYNRAEAELAHLQSERVIGKNFFTEIAPCTAVKEFEGRFHEFINSNEQMVQFNFTFSFNYGPVDVEIFLLRCAVAPTAQARHKGCARIIVKRVGAF